MKSTRDTLADEIQHNRAQIRLARTRANRANVMTVKYHLEMAIVDAYKKRLARCLKIKAKRLDDASGRHD